MLPVFDEQLAQYLGLDDFRVGARRLHEGHGPKVLAFWSVSVMPSFERQWVIGAVYEEEWTDGADPDRILCRGFVVDHTEAAITPLETDDVLPALESLNPFRIAPTHRKKVQMFEVGPGGGVKEMWVELGVRDGISYNVRWETRASGGCFLFPNPRFDWQIEFLQKVIRLGERITESEGNNRLQEKLRSRFPTLKAD